MTDLISSGNTKRSGCGRYPTIGVNNNGIVVEMHQAAGTSYLYCSVGVFNDGKDRIKWGKDTYMNESGDYANIAINNKNQVIEVHESQGFRRAVWYRFGTVNKASMTIKWEGSSTLVDNGKNPTVALNNNGKVIIAYECAFVGYETYCWAGNLTPSESNKVKFIKEKFPLFRHARNGVTEISVAINGEGYMVAAGRGTGHNLVFIVGKFSSDESVTWENETEYDMQGQYPSVAIDDKLRVISVQQSNLFRELSHRVGKISKTVSGGHSLSWCSEKKTYDHGCLPVIAASNDGTMIVEEHETNFAFFGFTGNNLFNRICSFNK